MTHADLLIALTYLLRVGAAGFLITVAVLAVVRIHAGENEWA